MLKALFDKGFGKSAETHLPGAMAPSNTTVEFFVQKCAGTSVLLVNSILNSSKIVSIIHAF